MVKYREILRQRAMGISIRNIAFSCKCSTATVVTVVDRAKARGLEWPLPEEMNDAAIRAVIYPREPKPDASKAEIDHERVDKEMERPGVTLMVLWSEYCDAALASGKEPYMYSAFCQKHRSWAAANKVAMHIERKPAQEMQVDYVGDTMAVLELLGIANRLGAARDADSVTAWLLEYNAWCVRWADFLKEHTVKDGKRVYTHERLRKARRGLNKLVRDGTLFTFVEMRRERGGERPSTNNAVESVNSRIRDMLYLHRGLPLMHHIKAIFWWCYMHTERPLPAAEILRVMPTDDEVEGLFAAASRGSGRDDGAPAEYGNGIVWSEFHMPTEYRR